ncbi:Uncharacterised protein [Staphylococcus microti]|uniref:Bacteriocin n=1 Tax=Staphylococcus microti TaxID=569857 RepID=A0A380GWL6_9STAP|nr:bacteriocin [Staphylococcus microti]SUM57995.1 Uncharacterised protein [Staphylococcus microti]
MKKLNTSELKKINGGDFFRDLGKIIHDYYVPAPKRIPYNPKTKK